MLDPGPVPFRVDWADDGDSHVIAVHGEVDLATAADLRTAFHRAALSSSREIVVDLGFCTFIDSSGIAALLTLNRRVAGSIRRDLLILPGPPQVQRVFAICDLLDVLPFQEGTTAPLATLSAYAPSGFGSVPSTTAR